MPWNRWPHHRGIRGHMFMESMATCAWNTHVLTPVSEKGSGMVAKARELAEQNGWFLAGQFENEVNADIHSQTTAEEILADFAEGGLDYWVSGFGTGGTLKGVARVLKAKSPRTRIVACEPDNSAILASGIGQTFRADGSPAASHPGFRPHLMQGWSPDFIPKLAADVLEARLIDEFRAVPGRDALACARRLARQEGVLCGISGGATLAAALEVAGSAPRGSRILAMLPDTGERYLSTALFADVHDEMTAEEQAISDSTSGFRFHGGSSSRPSPVPLTEPTVDAVAHVEEIISDPKHSIVIFALEWCEFCWSVRQLFGAAGISFRSIDLDSAEYRKKNWGGEVRKALARKTGSVTIPQIFVGGEHIGGATETFDAFNSGTLKRKLEKLEMRVDSAAIPDAYSFLPAWLHPR